jgi:hypothetical protein
LDICRILGQNCPKLDGVSGFGSPPPVDQLKFRDVGSAGDHYPQTVRRRRQHQGVKLTPPRKNNDSVHKAISLNQIVREIGNEY